VMSPSDCVKWRIGPWGTSTKPATTTTGIRRPLRSVCHSETLRSLRIPEVRCRVPPQQQGRGRRWAANGDRGARSFSPANGTTHVDFIFTAQLCRAVEGWLLPGHGRRAASVCMACPRVVRRVALPVCRPPAGLSVPTIARTERPRCPRGAVQRPAASPCPPDAQVHSDAGREHKRG
jgi:hypothetical protein